MKQPILNENFRYHPAVFAFEDCYRIMTWVNCDMLLWIEVDGEKYYDSVGGVLRSSCAVHRVEIPTAALDTAKAYTVCYRTIENREPYHAEVSDEVRVTYAFKPVPASGDIYAYQLADTHDRMTGALRAGAYFGEKLNVLFLTGDIQNHTQTTEQYRYAFALASALTGGSVPVVYTRGNHDGRGAAAELFYDYTPFDRDRAYYWFRLGSLYGIVLDCGEDKPDTNVEYSGTVCFSQYRERQTAWLTSLLDGTDFASMENTHRLIVSHAPFSYTMEPPFDIEVRRYTGWVRTLETHFQPELMLSGHLHTAGLFQIGGALDSKGQTCPVVVATTVDGHNPDSVTLTGSAYIFSENRIHLSFTDETKAETDSFEIPARPFTK